MKTAKFQTTGSKKPEEKFSYFFALEKLFSEISERPRQIILGRYGIHNGKVKTLEEIGKEYEITRERVRQIIRETVKKIKKGKNENLFKVEDKIRFTIKEKNGIIKEEELLTAELEFKEKGALKFFLELFETVSTKEIPGELEKSWSAHDFEVNEWRRIKNSVKDILNEIQNPLSHKDLLDKVSNLNEIEISHDKITNYLSVSSEIKKSKFGKWGLSSWDEINPKGTREKIYLILKETGKPLHFREIAALIDKHKLNKKEKTHPQTVHNELIRDKRFILVGRGIYALSEWGYQKGTVKEVLDDIFKKSNKPLGRDEIISKVLAVRKVKKSTILINLNNFFQKTEKDRYFIRK